jgi:hypothetical protein
VRQALEHRPAKSENAPHNELVVGQFPDFTGRLILDELEWQESGPASVAICAHVEPECEWRQM